jgi:hypothetical protein
MRMRAGLGLVAVFAEWCVSSCRSVCPGLMTFSCMYAVAACSATPQQAQSETEEAKRRRTSYSSLPTSFIASLVLPAPANMRGVYHLECEVKYGDMEIQLQLPEIGFEAMPSRVPLEWSPLDVVYFLRSQRLPIDPAAEQLSNHEGTAVDGPMLVRDGTCSRHGVAPALAMP